jgi:hypothetical protein
MRKYTNYTYAVELQLFTSDIPLLPLSNGTSYSAKRSMIEALTNEELFNAQAYIYSSLPGRPNCSTAPSQSSYSFQFSLILICGAWQRRGTRDTIESCMKTWWGYTCRLYSKAFSTRPKCLLSYCTNLRLMLRQSDRCPQA